jgi:pSer/pThr/pTyr-binding forkhead associated (FHA) protein
MVRCPGCGVENTTDSNFCRRCGERLPEYAASSETTATGSVRQAGELDLPPGDDVSVTGTVLRILSAGDRHGEVVPVVGDALTIGRSPQSDLFLDDVTVSRNHARIVTDSMGYAVQDLDSLNGTYVNRKRIERHLLFDGDELQVGKFRLVFLQPSLDE